MSETHKQWATGDRVTWTDPENGAEHPMLVLDATHPEVIALLPHHGGEWEAQPHEISPHKTWPETDRERKAFEIWMYEAGQGNTVASFREWYAGYGLNDD